MKIAMLTFLIGIGSLAMRASASEPISIKGWYIQAAAGANWVATRDTDRTVIVTPIAHFTQQATMVLRRGTTFSGAIGRKVGTRLRLEGEFAQRDSEQDHLTIHGSATPASKYGRLKSTSLMFNGVCSFLNDSRVKPYLGAGIGGTELDMIQVDSTASGQGKSLALAVQAIGGVGLSLSGGWELFTQYNYFVAPNAGLTAVHSRGTTTIENRVSRYDSHSASVGIRYNF